MGAFVDSSAKTISPRLVDRHTVGKALFCDAFTPSAEQEPAKRSKYVLTLPAASLDHAKYRVGITGVVMNLVLSVAKQASLADGVEEVVVKQYPVTPFVSLALAVKVS